MVKYVYDLYNSGGRYLDTFNSMEEYLDAYVDEYPEPLDRDKLWKELQHEIKGAEAMDQNQYAVFDDQFMIKREDKEIEKSDKTNHFFE